MKIDVLDRILNAKPKKDHSDTAINCNTRYNVVTEKWRGSPIPNYLKIQAYKIRGFTLSSKSANISEILMEDIFLKTSLNHIESFFDNYCFFFWIAACAPYYSIIEFI